MHCSDWLELGGMPAPRVRVGSVGERGGQGLRRKPSHCHQKTEEGWTFDGHLRQGTTEQEQLCQHVWDGLQVRGQLQVIVGMK